MSLSANLCELLTKGIPVRQKVGPPSIIPYAVKIFMGLHISALELEITSGHGFCPLSAASRIPSPSSHILITNNIKFLRFGKLKITANISYRATRHGISGISFRAQFQSKLPFYVPEWGLSALALVQTWKEAIKGNVFGRLMSIGGPEEMEPVTHPLQLTV